MTEYVTQEQLVAAVPGLSKARLAAFLRADLLQPLQSPSGPLFRPLDVARSELLCDLADHFDLSGDALGVVIGLIDQLHDTRRHLHAMAQAMEAEPQGLRRRVGARLIGILAV
jgi:chaperone modulatory protein CbpM